MSTEKNTLSSIIEQYEAKNKSNFVKSETPKYDLKNYFNTFIEKGVKSATKNIRILPTNGESPFVEVHVHSMKIGTETKKFACLKEEKGLPCPFCEAREALLATGKESDKKLAKNYKARLVYVVKIIDRDKPEEGVKFWRINDDWGKEGVYDKIFGISLALKKDITSSETGRDLAILVNRNQNDIPVVSSVSAMDPTPLSTDAAQAELWLSDVRTWENVYSVKNYDYLEILVKGGYPVWDKEAKKFVDKAALKPESDNTEGEITMGVENVKAGIVAATTTTTTTVKEAEGLDDLPF